MSQVPAPATIFSLRIQASSNIPLQSSTTCSRAHIPIIRLFNLSQPFIAEPKSIFSLSTLFPSFDSQILSPKIFGLQNFASLSFLVCKTQDWDWLYLIFGLRRLCFPGNSVRSMFQYKTRDWVRSYLVSALLSLLYFLSIHPISRVLCVLCVNSDSMP